MWYNPPYSQNVATDIARQFLSLITKHFPKNHKYSKLFNRNNVKCSYRTMPSMGAIINSHNARILADPEPISRECSCKKDNNGDPIDCPLGGKCLIKNIVYKATVTAAGKQTKTYFGLTATTFKVRLYNHRQSFTNEQLQHETRLSTYMWDLWREGTPGEIKWEIAMKSRPYRGGTRRCDLCTSEKLAILLADGSGLLNKRSEIIATCRHRKKFK